MRKNSKVLNDSALLRLQAKGIEAIVRDVEASSGIISQEEKAEADRRLEEARIRAAQRRAARNPVA
jgi:hypothetical protein